MTTTFIALISSVFFIISTPITSFVDSPNAKIIGEWINEKKDAKFEIYESENKIYGKLIWGTGGDPKDIKNPDPTLRNRDVIGLTILKNFEFKSKNVWSDGTIYDPKDGKTYSCKLTLVSNNKLEVKGYVGISLFGRTETWTKIK